MVVKLEDNIYGILIRIAIYFEYNYIGYCDDKAIDDVTLPRWKSLDFSSRQTNGILGEDIMMKFWFIWYFDQII